MTKTQENLPRTAKKKGSKHTIAAAVVEQLPELAPKLPPRRKCWQSEDYRMGIFDAAAVGVAYFVRYKERRSNVSVESNPLSQETLRSHFRSPI